MKLTSIIILSAILFSCKEQNDDKRLKEICRSEVFDPSVNTRFPLYDSLKKLLFENIDTIFRFRNKNNIITHQSYDVITSSQEDEFEYSFKYTFRTKTLSGPQKENALPDHLIPAFLRLLEQFNGDQWFTLNRDSSIYILLKSSEDPKTYATIYHTLRWDNYYNPDTTGLEKIMRYSGNWRYSIRVEPYVGW